MKYIMLASCAILLWGRASHAAPSFDCKLAHSPVEHLICSSPSLQAKDVSVAKAYQDARELHPNNIDVLKHDQLAWWKAREACAAQSDDARACVDKVYDARLNSLADTAAPATQETQPVHVATTTTTAHSGDTVLRPHSLICQTKDGLSEVLQHIKDGDSAVELQKVGDRDVCFSSGALRSVQMVSIPEHTDIFFHDPSPVRIIVAGNGVELRVWTLYNNLYRAD